MIRLKDLTLKINEELLFSVSSFEFEKGRNYLLIGENGTGKSSLLKSLIGQFLYYEGMIEVEGEVVYQSQDPFLYQRTVRDNLRLVGMREDRMKEDLKLLFAEDILNKKVRVLSGGQRQKTALLRSLYRAEDILLLDEPFSQMDEKSSLAAQRLVRRWYEEKEGRIVVIVSHDAELSEMSFEAGILLKDYQFQVIKI